jgi:hypothetical protein
VVPLLDRFWSRVARRSANECWPWQGEKTGDGYGMILRAGAGSQKLYAHRLSLAISIGIDYDELPDLQVCHECDNPPCVNPVDLFLGTQGDNMKDMASKARSTWGERSNLAKLTAADVLAVRAAMDAGTPPSMVALRFGISERYAYALGNREYWKHLVDAPL